MLYLLVIPMTLLGALGAYFFKRATGKGQGLLSLAVSPELYLGGGFYLGGALLNIFLLRHLEYSIVYPMTAVTYIWSAVLSYFLLRERIGKRKAVGIGMILLGVILIAQ